MNTFNATRFCASCNREHGRSYLCSSYSPDTVTLIKLEENTPASSSSPWLAFGAPGNGVNQLLATVATATR